ncbi:MAG: CopG family transcriptional regulator [Gemmatimonadaceae bacterium]
MSNMYAMKRTSLFLDERLLRSLSRAAKQRQVSVASLIREAVANYLSDSVAGGRLPSVAGRFSSGGSDTADRNEELLWRDPHQ